MPLQPPRCIHLPAKNRLSYFYRQPNHSIFRSGDQKLKNANPPQLQVRRSPSRRQLQREKEGFVISMPALYRHSARACTVEDALKYLTKTFAAWKRWLGAHFIISRGTSAVLPLKYCPRGFLYPICQFFRFDHPRMTSPAQNPSFDLLNACQLHG